MEKLGEICLKYNSKKIIINGLLYEYRINVREIGQLAHSIEIDICIVQNGYEVITFKTEYHKERSVLEIVDIQNCMEDRNRGYGSLGMEVLFECGAVLGIKKYYGILSYIDVYDKVDRDHRNRLEHFYKKFGFSVDFETMKIEKMVS